MSVTKWALDGVYKQDPNKVRAEIDSLGDKYTLHDIVEMARNEDHYMHSMFEWDDAVAGERYRENQAGKILRMLVVVNEEKPEQPPVRYIVSTGEGKREYTPITLVVRNEDAYADLLKRAYMELAAFKKKYATLSELNEVLRLIDELI